MGRRPLDPEVKKQREENKKAEKNLKKQQKQEQEADESWNEMIEKHKDAMISYEIITTNPDGTQTVNKIK